jgi:hypothetical protein
MMAAQVDPAIIDRARKLLARALDPSARDGEAEIAATMFVRALRRAGMNVDTFLEAFAPPPVVIEIEAEEPPELSAVLGFGKYAGTGMTFKDVCVNDASYLKWILRTSGHGGHRQSVVDAARIALEFFGHDIPTPEDDE